MAVWKTSLNCAFTNLRIWDGVAETYLDADGLLIEDGRIVAVGEAPKDARDMGGLTVIPGLMDAHVHMVLDPDIRLALDQDKVSAEDLEVALRRRAEAMLRAGITTARDLGGGQWQELALRDAIAAGELPGPRLLCSGQPITSPQGHCHFWGGEAVDADAAIDVLRRQVEHRVDLIKVMATGGSLTPKSRPVDPQFDADVLKRIVDEAASHGHVVAAHCHGTAGIRNAVHAGVRTIEHCSWVGEAGWGTDYDAATAALIAEREIWVSPTINAGWKRFLGRPGTGERMRENFRRMRAAGVRLVASTDAGIPNVRHHDLGRALVPFADLAELSNLEALQSATSDAAEALGIDHLTGRIAPGYAADLLFVDGDPLADLEVLASPACVVARGRVVDN